MFYYVHGYLYFLFYKIFIHVFGPYVSLIFIYLGYHYVVFMLQTFLQFVVYFSDLMVLSIDFEVLLVNVFKKWKNNKHPITFQIEQVWLVVSSQKFPSLVSKK